MWAVVVRCATWVRSSACARKERGGGCEGERVDMRGLGCNGTSGVRLTDVRGLRSGVALAPARTVGAGALSGGKGKMSGLGLSADMGRG